MPDTLTASSLYAISQGQRCEGQWECHWCGGPCSDQFTHDEPGEVTGTPRNRHRAKRPGNAYVCRGCWLWGRKRISVGYLHHDTGGIDGQTPDHHSWWITPEGAWGIHPAESKDFTTLLERLLEPPPQCVLSLLSRPYTPGIDHGPHFVLPIPNQIHLAIANDLPKVEAGSQIQFTLNNVPHTYTPYELEHATVHGWDGLEPGVRVLCELLGVTPSGAEKRGKGRPPALLDAEKALGKIIKVHKGHKPPGS